VVFGLLQQVLLIILPSISAIILIFYAVLYLNCSLRLFSVSMSVKQIIPVHLPVRVGQFSSETLTDLTLRARGVPQ
jgi:hypothetical protein